MRSLDATLSRLATLDREVGATIRKAQDRWNRKAVEVGSVSGEISNNIFHDPEVRRRAEARKAKEAEAYHSLAARSRGGGGRVVGETMSRSQAEWGPL